MQAGEIQAIADAALRAAAGAPADDASVDGRVADVAAASPAFAEGYPTLARMCCEATTEQKRQSVQHFLPLMLAHMSRVQSDPKDAGALHDASVAVGKAVGERYLPKPDQLPPPQTQTPTQTPQLSGPAEPAASSASSAEAADGLRKRKRGNRHGRGEGK